MKQLINVDEIFMKYHGFYCFYSEGIIRQRYKSHSACSKFLNEVSRNITKLIFNGENFNGSSVYIFMVQVTLQMWQTTLSAQDAIVLFSSKHQPYVLLIR